MLTECSRDLFGFEAVEGRQVVAAFDGGQVTSDAGALLLGAANRAIGLVQRLARCFADWRCQELVEHSVETMLMQRICGLALGYEDLVDHDELRHDPVLATLVGKLEAHRADCAPLAGKSTLNRLEHAPTSALDRYHKIGHEPRAIEGLFVELFLEAHKQPPERIVLDLDATDDPLHGHQEGRFFHGYYDGYCYLPLYVFCGRHLLAAKLRRSNIDASAGALDEVERIAAQIRARWPRVKIVLRADSGFARDELMSWCEANGVDYLFGLARNGRLLAAIEDPLAEAEAEHGATGRPARRFDDFPYATARPSTRTSTAPVGTWRIACMDASRPASRFLLRSGMRGRLLLCIRPRWATRPRASMSSASWLPIIKASSKLFGSHGLCQPRSDRHVIASKNTPRSLWRSRQSRFSQASIRPPPDRLRRGSALPRPSGRAYWPPPLPPR